MDRKYHQLILMFGACIRIRINHWIEFKPTIVPFLVSLVLVSKSQIYENKLWNLFNFQFQQINGSGTDIIENIFFNM